MANKFDLEEAIRKYDFGNFADDISWQNVELPEIGMVERVASHGGEGQGDEAWVVFEVDGELYRITGYYSSYDGFNWEEYSAESIESVVATPVTVITYVKK